MMEAPHALLTALDRLGVRMDIQGDRIVATGHTERMTPTMAGQVRQLKQQLLEELAQRQALLDRLLHRISQASNWLGLEQVVAEALTAWSEGRLAPHQAEAVAEASIPRSRTIPPHVPDLDPNDVTWPPLKKKDRCPTCKGRNWWWDPYDRRICGICHPKPPDQPKNYKAVIVAAKPAQASLPGDVDKLYGPDEAPATNASMKGSPHG